MPGDVQPLVPLDRKEKTRALPKAQWFYVSADRRPYGRGRFQDIRGHELALHDPKHHQAPGSDGRTVGVAQRRPAG